MKLCLNQATTMPYGLSETIDAAARAGIPHIGLWVEPVEATGVAATRRLLADTGVTATSMSRVGFLADKSGRELDQAYDAVRRALAACAELSVPTLSFVAGGLPAHDRSIRSAEARVRDALERLQPDVAASGVRLQLEPIHPLFVNDRSMVTTVGQALRIVDGLPAEQYGVLVDSWATFWDPEFEDSVARAGAEGRLAGYQINDYALPLPFPNNMNGRLMPGDGVIDLVGMTRTMRSAGYSGPVENEVFNDEIWRLPLAEIVRLTVESFDRVITRNFPD